MIGDVILIVVVGFALIMSVRFRKRGDALLRRMKEGRIRLATDIQRTRAESLSLKTRIGMAQQLKESSEKEVERRGKELAEAEALIHRASQQPPMRIYVMDRTQIRPERLWVVTFQRERDVETDFTRTYRWGAHRHLILSAGTAQEAEERVRLRFPAAVGYRLLPPRSHAEVTREMRL